MKHLTEKDYKILATYVMIKAMILSAEKNENFVVLSMLKSAETETQKQLNEVIERVNERLLDSQGEPDEPSQASLPLSDRNPKSVTFAKKMWKVNKWGGKQ